MAEQQIKSRQRVAERGEVFTAEREVNAMLDLVKQETERIDSRFLEPACGNGNFLVEILRRKLEVIRRQYQKRLSELELQTTIAESSIYGVDIMKDNVEESCQRLRDIVCRWYSEVHPLQKAPSQKLSAVWSYLLHRNILWGDALTLREPVSEKATIIEKRDAKPITFSDQRNRLGDPSVIQEASEFLLKRLCCYNHIKNILYLCSTIAARMLPHPCGVNINIL